MSGARPSAKTIAAVFIGLLVGVSLGAVAAQRATRPEREMNAYLVAQQLETQSYLRYRFADADVGSRSLAAYADFLERERGVLQKLQPNWYRKRAGLAYARLAVLAERAGNTAGRDRYLDLARMQFAIDGSAISRTELNAAVRSADEEWDREVKTAFSGAELQR